MPGAASTPTRLHHAVAAERAGARLDALLAALYPDISRARWQRFIDDGLVQVEGRAVRPSHKVREGERIDVELPAPAPAGPAAEAIPIALLYEDGDLLAIDKPAGQVVHPAPGAPAGTLVNALLHHFPEIAIGDVHRPGIVHRLDRDTSGVLLVARNDRAMSALQAAFKDRRVEKRYLALVHGAPPDAGEFDTLHGRHPTDRKRFTTRVREGRRAVTRYRVLERFQDAALVAVDLVTGRTHQVRVHFSDAGFPLLADAIYGGVRRETRLRPDDPVRRAAEAIGRQALHAERIRLAHPVSGAALEIASPLPASFEAALAILRSGRGTKEGKGGRPRAG